MTYPTSPDQIDLDRWETIQPVLDDLIAPPLTTNDVPGWLAEWSRFAEILGEATTLVSLAYQQNTEDQAAKDAYMHLIREVSPRLRVWEQGMKDKLLDTGWDGPEMATALERFRADKSIYRDENVPLQSEEAAKSARYSELIGGLTVEWDGQTRTLTQLVPFKASPDRAVRESAWRAGYDKMQSVRDELDSLYDEMLALRVQIAKNAGFSNYRDYKWQQLARFDYTPDHAAEFRQAILSEVVPALRRLSGRRAAALGLPSLRPWDLEADPFGGEPLRPFEGGEALAEGSRRIFAALDPELGERVRTMQAEGLLDLDNRKGKAPGGFCTSLPFRKRPFIFMNAVGTEDNVRTMLHEAGHAFHVFEAAKLPLAWQRRSPMEFNEVASMAMELLTGPYITQPHGGFYDARDAIRSRVQHLERIITFLPYMAVVDGFQEWVYAHPLHTHEERDAAWLELHQAYCVEADWSGLEEGRRSLWQHKLHIFQVPFYYIEYGIAQIGALQVWQNSLTDPKKALDQYLAALRLGGMVSLTDLYRTAGVRLAFDAKTVGELVALVEGTVSRLEEQLGEERAA